MSLASAIVARADSHAGLSALIGDRIFRDSAYQDIAVPYIVFEIRDSTPENTFRRGEDLAIARVDAKLYAASAPALDELENQWRQAFGKHEGTHRGQTFKTWVSSARDEVVEGRLTDIAARLYLRVMQVSMTLEPA